MTTEIYNWNMTLWIFAHFNSKINCYKEPCWNKDFFQKKINKSKDYWNQQHIRDVKRLRFKKIIIAENFPSLRKELYTQIHEAKRTSNYLIAKRSSLRHIILKLSKVNDRASLVAQWLRIRLPMQGTRVRALVREDPTYHGATKPVRHNYWGCALEPTSHNYWVHVLQLLKPVRLEPVLRNKRNHRNEKPAHHNEE